MDVVLSWVSTYGYAAIFFLLVLGIVGLPVPDEWLLVFSGYLAFSGRLHLTGVLLSAFSGSACGITCSYLLGRNVGLPLLISRFGRYVHISERHIVRVHDWFNRIGHWALFVGYYIPGVRHFTALVAGTSRLEFRAFALYAYSGALLWVCTFVWIGYHFGERGRTVLALVEANLRLAIVIGGVLVAGYALFRYLLRSKTNRRPL